MNSLERLTTTLFLTTMLGLGLQAQQIQQGGVRVNKRGKIEVVKAEEIKRSEKEHKTKISKKEKREYQEINSKLLQNLWPTYNLEDTLLENETLEKFKLYVKLFRRVDSAYNESIDPDLAYNRLAEKETKIMPWTSEIKTPKTKKEIELEKIYLDQIQLIKDAQSFIIYDKKDYDKILEDIKRIFLIKKPEYSLQEYAKEIQRIMLYDNHYNKEILKQKIFAINFLQEQEQSIIKIDNKNIDNKEKNKNVFVKTMPDNPLEQIEFLLSYEQGNDNSETYKYQFLKYISKLENQKKLDSIIKITKPLIDGAIVIDDSLKREIKKLDPTYLKSEIENKTNKLKELPVKGEKTIKTQNELDLLKSNLQELESEKYNIEYQERRIRNLEEFMINIQDQISNEAHVRRKKNAGIYRLGPIENGKFYIIEVIEKKEIGNRTIRPEEAFINRVLPKYNLFYENDKVSKLKEKKEEKINQASSDTISTTKWKIIEEKINKYNNQINKIEIKKQKTKKVDVNLLEQETTGYTQDEKTFNILAITIDQIGNKKKSQLFLQSIPEYKIPSVEQKNILDKKYHSGIYTTSTNPQEAEVYAINVINTAQDELSIRKKFLTENINKILFSKEIEIQEQILESLKEQIDTTKLLEVNYYNVAKKSKKVIKKINQYENSTVNGLENELQTKRNTQIQQNKILKENENFQLVIYRIGKIGNEYEYKTIINNLPTITEDINKLIKIKN